MKYPGTPILALSVALAASLSRPATASQDAPAKKEFKGSDLSGWETVVGDGLYSAPGEQPVHADDILTVQRTDHSELFANVRRRRIMAHNITFKRIIDDKAFDYVHRYGIKFRLPAEPAGDPVRQNGETVEFGLFIWDGNGTRLDHGLAYQWKINPWDHEHYGDILYWDKTQWVAMGNIRPDDAWHEIEFVADFRAGEAEVKLDGIVYPGMLTETPKDPSWGTETAARIQAEIVSVYPEPAGLRETHRLQVKDWHWDWDPAPQGFSQLTRDPAR